MLKHLSLILLFSGVGVSAVHGREASSVSTETFIHINNSFSELPVLIAQEIPAIQEEGFVFEFLGCETTPNTDEPLTCELLIENSRETERRLALYASRSNRASRVIDAGGNEIFASLVQLGEDSSENYAETFLPEGVPLKAVLTFAEAPEGGIRILDINAYDYGGGGYFDIEFRFSR